MQLESGRTVSKKLIDLALAMDQHGFVRHGPPGSFPLSSGLTSRVYISGREDLTDNPAFEWQLGMAMADDLRTTGPLDFPDSGICLIGVPSAGRKLAQVMAHASHQNVGDSLITYRELRSVKKKHGAHLRWVDGDATLDMSVGLVDNALTTGNSVLNAAEKLREDGYVGTPRVFVVVDRELGGKELLQAKGHLVTALFRISELAEILCRMDRWPKKVFDEVIAEIDSHLML